MKHSLLTFWGLTTVLTLLGSADSAQAQVMLGSSPYVEKFDNLAAGLPEGFTVRTKVRANALGTAIETFATTSVLWNNSGGAFKNFASATDLSVAATEEQQNAAPNRALGVRQTGAFADGTTDYGPAFVFQLANTSSRTAFKLNFLLQSLDASATRTTTWRVDYATGATPTTFTSVGATFTTGATTFSNTPVAVDFGSALDNIDDIVWIRISSPTLTSGSGTRASSAIDDFSLAWTTTASTAPTLAVTPNNLRFGRTNLTTTSEAASYTLTGSNLTGATTVTAPAGFAVAKTATGSFGSTLSYTPAELATPQTVYVHFAPTTAGYVTRTITNSSPDALDRTVAVVGTGVDPNNNLFSFDECPTPTASFDGWVQYSVSGDQVWECTAEGRSAADATGAASAPNGVRMNGYAGGYKENEDWFISPAFDLSTYQFPLLSFWSRVLYGGPALTLRVSTNYSGSGNPSAATWTELPVPFAAGNTWTLTDNVDLSAYKGSQVHVAFVYKSTTTTGARWTLDDLRLQNSATPAQVLLATSARRLAFGYQAVGAATPTTRTFTLTARNLTAPVTITSSTPVFTVSKDGTTFSNSVSYPAAEANGATVTVRFVPAQAAANYSTPLSIATAGATTSAVNAYGNTIDPAVTLDVVNWNIEWFGATAAGQGPANKTLQQTNASTVLKALDADVFALAEIVDTVKLGALVRQMPGYRYQVADYASGATSPSSGNYATAQKLAFVYRTSVVANPTFKGLLRCDACDQYGYWASGRFPYLMAADVTMNDQTKRVNFVVIHAKANDEQSVESYNRRAAGATGLKAELDANYGTENVIILGDYNDDLNQTIATGTPTTASSYSVFTNDVANYQALTLPLTLAGEKSTVDYSSVIDNMIISSEMAAYYVTNSTQIRTDIASQIADYGTTTSDHYPVQARYSFAMATLPTQSAAANRQFDVYPNPVTNTIRLALPQSATTGLRLQVHAVDGRKVVEGAGSLEQLNQHLNQNLGQLAPGMYILQVTGGAQTYVKRIVKQ